MGAAPYRKAKSLPHCGQQQQAKDLLTVDTFPEEYQASPEPEKQHMLKQTELWGVGKSSGLGNIKKKHAQKKN